MTDLLQGYELLSWGRATYSPSLHRQMKKEDSDDLYENLFAHSFSARTHLRTCEGINQLHIFIAVRRIVVHCD